MISRCPCSLHSLEAPHRATKEGKHLLDDRLNSERYEQSSPATNLIKASDWEQWKTRKHFRGSSLIVRYLYAANGMNGTQRHLSCRLRKLLKKEGEIWFSQNLTLKCDETREKSKAWENCEHFSESKSINCLCPADAIALTYDARFDRMRNFEVTCPWEGEQATVGAQHIIDAIVENQQCVTKNQSLKL